MPIYSPSVNFPVFVSHMSVCSHYSPFPPVHGDHDELHGRKFCLSSRPSIPSINSPSIYLPSVYSSSVNFPDVFGFMSVYSHDSLVPSVYEDHDELHRRKICLPSRRSIHRMFTFPVRALPHPSMSGRYAPFLLLLDCLSRSLLNTQGAAYRDKGRELHV